jgi:hypothetical protein
MIILIELALILFTAFLIRNANKLRSITSYVFVLLCGIILFVFEATIVAFTGGDVSGGAIQLFAEMFGIYCIIWSIVKMIKGNKKDSATIITKNE